jgi:hypothetical protein
MSATSTAFVGGDGDGCDSNGKKGQRPGPTYIQVHHGHTGVARWHIFKTKDPNLGKMFG